MPALILTNRYLRQPSLRRRWLEESVHQSSTFEGARGLKKVKAVHKLARKRRSITSTKKSRSGT
jgi:hypothetical protein